MPRTQRKPNFKASKPAKSKSEIATDDGFVTEPQKPDQNSNQNKNVETKETTTPETPAQSNPKTTQKPTPAEMPLEPLPKPEPLKEKTTNEKAADEQSNQKKGESYQERRLENPDAKPILPTPRYIDPTPIESKMSKVLVTNKPHSRMFTYSFDTDSLGFDYVGEPISLIEYNAVPSTTVRTGSVPILGPELAILMENTLKILIDGTAYIDFKLTDDFKHEFDVEDMFNVPVIQAFLSKQTTEVLSTTSSLAFLCADLNIMYNAGKRRVLIQRELKDVRLTGNVGRAKFVPNTDISLPVKFSYGLVAEAEIYPQFNDILRQYPEYATYRIGRIDSERRGIHAMNVVDWHAENRDNFASALHNIDVALYLNSNATSEQIVDELSCFVPYDTIIYSHGETYKPIPLPALPLVLGACAMARFQSQAFHDITRNMVVEYLQQMNLGQIILAPNFISKNVAMNYTALAFQLSDLFQHIDVTQIHEMMADEIVPIYDIGKIVMPEFTNQSALDGIKLLTYFTHAIFFPNHNAIYIKQIVSKLFYFFHFHYPALHEAFITQYGFRYRINANGQLQPYSREPYLDSEIFNQNDYPSYFRLNTEARFLPITRVASLLLPIGNFIEHHRGATDHYPRYEVRPGSYIPFVPPAPYTITNRNAYTLRVQLMIQLVLELLSTSTQALFSSITREAIREQISFIADRLFDIVDPLHLHIGLAYHTVSRFPFLEFANFRGELATHENRNWCVHSPTRDGAGVRMLRRFDKSKTYYMADTWAFIMQFDFTYKQSQGEGVTTSNNFKRMINFPPPDEPFQQTRCIIAETIDQFSIFGLIGYLWSNVNNPDITAIIQRGGVELSNHLYTTIVRHFLSKNQQYKYIKIEDHNTRIVEYLTRNVDVVVVNPELRRVDNVGAPVPYNPAIDNPNIQPALTLLAPDFLQKLPVAAALIETLHTKYVYSGVVFQTQTVANEDNYMQFVPLANQRVIEYHNAMLVATRRGERQVTAYQENLPNDNRRIYNYEELPRAVIDITAAQVRGLSKPFKEFLQMAVARGAWSIRRNDLQYIPVVSNNASTISKFTMSVSDMLEAQVDQRWIIPFYYEPHIRFDQSYNFPTVLGTDVVVRPVQNILAIKSSVGIKFQLEQGVMNLPDGSEFDTGTINNAYLPVDSEDNVKHEQHQIYMSNIIGSVRNVVTTDKFEMEIIYPAISEGLD